MRDPNRGYTVVAFYMPGQEEASLVSCNGRVIVFDTPNQARDIVSSSMCDGRWITWDASGERAYLTPVLPNRVNRYVLITDYDIYNLPANFPVSSETRCQPWVHHIHWAEWWNVPVERDITKLKVAPEAGYGTLEDDNRVH